MTKALSWIQLCPDHMTWRPLRSSYIECWPSTKAYEGCYLEGCRKLSSYELSFTVEGYISHIPPGPWINFWCCDEVHWQSCPNCGNEVYVKA